MVDPTLELIAQLIEFEFLIFIEFFYEKDYWKWLNISLTLDFKIKKSLPLNSTNWRPSQKSRVWPQFLPVKVWIFWIFNDNIFQYSIILAP